MFKYDNIIINCFFTTKLRRKIISKFENNLDKYCNISNYLQHRYNNFENYRATLYRIFNHIEILPKCKYCGCELTYEQSTKSQFCCQKHRRLYQVEQTKQTCLNRYGVNNVMQLDNVKQKIINNTDYNKRNIKLKQTLLKKYNVDNAGKLENTIQKSHSKEAITKRIKTYKETCIKRYGVDNVAKTNEVQNKIKQTCLKKYGVTNVFASDIVKLKLNYNEQIKHGNITKKINNSFHISNDEKLCFDLLSLLYTHVERQYSSKEYPYLCDFYITDIDTYIEYNGTWTHGGHPYDENNIDDISKVNLWKSKNNEYYNNAIKTWTVYDVNKRNIAIKNNLNFIELWNLNDVYNYILSIPCIDCKLKEEFEYYKKTTGKLNKINSKCLNIVKYFQQDIFYKKERELFCNKNIREKLIDNRKKYLNKEVFTVNEILKGFKVSGIHYGYSHFNPLWFKWFIETYNIKTCYDPCGGWGHRLLGGLNLDLYIYNDLSITTFNNVNRIIKYFNIQNTVIYNNDATLFIPNETFDSMFTCPPYYNIEEYECDSFESIEKYYEFIDSLFNIFYKCSNCNIFGLVIREDLLQDKWKNKSQNQYLLNTSISHLITHKLNNEYLYIFIK